MGNLRPQAVTWRCASCAATVSAMVVPGLEHLIDVSCPECGYDDLPYSDPRRQHEKDTRRRRFRLNGPPRQQRPL